VRALLATVVMLYLCLDLGAPQLPGALAFDLDESVEAVQLQRDPTPSPPSVAVTPTPLLGFAPVAPQRVARQFRPRPDTGPLFHAVRRIAPAPPGPEEG